MSNENLQLIEPSLEYREDFLALAEEYFEQFQHPRTFVLYGARLSTKDGWTSPADIKTRKPKPPWRRCAKDMPPNSGKPATARSA